VIIDSGVLPGSKKKKKPGSEATDEPAETG
jgi:hypothetical protein